MYNQQETRERIQRRRDKYAKQQSSTTHKGMIPIMILGILTISYLSIGHEKSMSIFHNTIDFLQTKLPWSFLIPFESVFKEDVEEVSGNIGGYVATSKVGYYTNDTNTAISLGDGLVVYVEDDVDQRFIVVSYENGVSVTYGNLQYTEVVLYDRVLKGDSLGVYNDEILLEAMRDNMDLDMEEAFLLFED
ncbi:MAG: hypothetical protein IJP28_06845 [Erysipelotrichales bacterium]|nr:hypothetical protein [Erysipelotrichales bacterium]